VALAGQAVNVTVGNVTQVEFKASVALAKSSSKLSSPRAFELSLSAQIQPYLSSSVLKAQLKTIKVTNIILLSGNKQIQLTQDETNEYLTYANLFL